MLAPLSQGRHEIRFRAVVGNPQNPDFEERVTYQLTIRR
jgi:hypothetical protein